MDGQMEVNRVTIPVGYKLVEDKPKRPAPKSNRGVSKLPFSPEEWALIDEHSQTMPWEIRGSRRGGQRGEFNPMFVWELCHFLRGTAAHISMVYLVGPGDVYEEHGFLRIRWPRPKDSVHKLVDPPFLKREEFESWVREFLGETKPKSEQAYSHLFRSLADHIERETRVISRDGSVAPGRRVKINGLRFRHTAFVRWLHDFGIPRRTVCVWGGTTERTLNYYDNPPDADISEMLAAKGLL
jgi:hypothetical protein